MNNPASLEGKVIVVSGAGQGIGKALTEQILAMGGKVAAVDLNAEALAESFAGNDDVQRFAGDVTDENFVDQMVQQAAEALGDVNGLLNNAGIVRAAMITHMTREQWQQVIDVNLTGAFTCLQAVGRFLVNKARSGDPNPGSIVNVSSVAGRRGTIGQINYGAAKSGVMGLTMSAAREWARYNINVNSVCFGVVETTMTETIRQDKFRDQFLEKIPLGRFSTPGDVVPATCFLLSDSASYITGQHLGIDGGFHITA